uniref:Pyroglutamyl-peptidase I n=1 Tax=Attheya septentrionalis TaxID=420275 RepID=A0A7S2UIW6_9STRA|mmetsp:Transcript_27402/g.49763  ORF Transcript_27402/g.49763 Transcript_27402/m.49763 type:complete len:284 (+) Transcript_27402:87-938(+)
MAVSEIEALNTDEPERRQPRLSFLVTGFGPFRDAPENPSTVIVTKLVCYLKEREAVATEQNNDRTLLSSVTTTKIFETAALTVRSELDAIFEQLPETDGEKQSDIIVILHLGVNYRGKSFQIERYAYNDATFRIPDEKGYQPTGECLLPEERKKELGFQMETTLRVGDLCNDMIERGFTNNDDQSTAAGGNKTNQKGNEVVVVSTDPGRFVCNYTYCYGLDKCNAFNETSPLNDSNPSSNQRPRLHALFLHVPPFKREPEERQLDFVAQLMNAIRNQLLHTSR